MHTSCSFLSLQADMKRELFVVKLVVPFIFELRFLEECVDINTGKALVFPTVSCPPEGNNAVVNCWLQYVTKVNLLESFLFAR